MANAASACRAAGDEIKVAQLTAESCYFISF
jgi:hypothetical protein